VIDHIGDDLAGAYAPCMNLEKRSLNLAGHATSVALEPEFWTALETLAAARGVSLAALVRELDQARGERPLASACRVAALAARP
jgi:predicted DNA-binding ribbon-helix-helix protein